MPDLQNPATAIFWALIGGAVGLVAGSFAPPLISEVPASCSSARVWCFLYTWQTLIAGFFSVGSLIFAIVTSQRRELRREEVHRWADECIICLEKLYLISCVDDDFISIERKNNLRIEIAFESASLVERGRLFFKNEVRDAHGFNKNSAYRGYRPKILDSLVLAHQLARYWPADGDRIEDVRRVVAKKCLQEFVSLAQEEVGRQRAASANALSGGDRVDLNQYLKEMDHTKL